MLDMSKFRFNILSFYNMKIIINTSVGNNRSCVMYRENESEPAIWQDMTQEEQLNVCDSLIDFYNLFSKYIKNE